MFEAQFTKIIHVVSGAETLHILKWQWWGKSIMLKKALEGVSREVNSSSGTMQRSFSDSAIPRHSIFKAKHKSSK